VDLGHPWPDPTRAYFWPAVNKRPTRLWPEYFPTQRDFFWPEGQKIEKIDIFWGNFPNSNPNHKWLTRPDPGQKFWPGPITNKRWLPWVIFSGVHTAPDYHIQLSIVLILQMQTAYIYKVVTVFSMQMLLLLLCLKTNGHLEDNFDTHSWDGKL